ncbi:hypothetical protein T09_5057, partial [Trichinella sp. T9]
LPAIEELNKFFLKARQKMNDKRRKYGQTTKHTMYNIIHTMVKKKRSIHMYVCMYVIVIERKRFKKICFLFITNSAQQVRAVAMYRAIFGWDTGRLRLTAWSVACRRQTVPTARQRAKRWRPKIKFSYTDENATSSNRKKLRHFAVDKECV